MNEEQYHEVCEACDHVLMSPDSTLETVAIPWLHVIREHPSFLKDYEDLFDDSAQFGLARRLRSFLGWAHQLYLALMSTGRPWHGPGDLEQPVDVLFISHLVSTSQAGNEADFYFGDLPSRLHALGHRVVVALIDHTGLADESLAKSWKSSPVPHLIFAHSIDFREEWSVGRRLKREATRLAENSTSLAAGLLKRVFARASMEALSGGARMALRMSHQVNKIVAQVRPRVVIATYEGHAWERVTFAAAREAQPSVACIGYQHAAIFRLQHSARRNLQSRFNPDQLFAAGAVSEKQLQDSPRLGNLQIKILGSHRSGVGVKTAFKQISCTCLVLPEGITSECHLLFEFSLRCATLCPDIRFVWRLHPLVKFESLIAENPLFKNLAKNVELSALSLDDDIARASHVLYRGSTAVVKAACANVQPVYLELPGEMTVDPLYQLGDWRKKVTTPELFSAVVGQPHFGAVTSEGQLVAIQYCADFYRPIDTSVVVDLLQSRSEA